LEEDTIGRAKSREYPFTKTGKKTASFGIANHTEGDTPASLIKRADKCLYIAKNPGRNRVIAEMILANE